MFTEPAGFGEAAWQQTMELQSRKDVIERWLSDPGTPTQLIDVLLEMLANTERQLLLLRNHDEKPTR
jgi:hypothetical protein